jgi:hypothetical protein
MNNSNFLIDEKFYLKIGSSWTLDTIYLIIISPLGFFGLFFNLICFWILFHIKIKEVKLYQYLKVYSLCSGFICLILDFAFLTYSSRYFQDFYHPFVKIYRCRIYGYLMICLSFFSNLLDILISLDRITIFSTKINFFRNINPYKLCAVLLLFCLFINSPHVFVLEILNDDVYFNTNVMSFCVQNEIGKSNFGVIINMTVIVIRDIITLGSEIIASLLVIYYYKRYYKIYQYNVSYNVNNENLSFSNININSTVHMRDSIELKIRHRQKKGKKLLLMTIILSILSIITHFLGAIIFIFLINFLVENRILHFSIICLGSFSLVFKHFSNIFIFYFFNTNFQKQFKKIIF